MPAIRKTIREKRMEDFSLFVDCKNVADQGFASSISLQKGNIASFPLPNGEAYSMKTLRSFAVVVCAVAFVVVCLDPSFAVAQETIKERLHVDATDAPRNILHSTVTIPVAS